MGIRNMRKQPVKGSTPRNPMLNLKDSTMQKARGTDKVISLKSLGKIPNKNPKGF